MYWVHLAQIETLGSYGNDNGLSVSIKCRELKEHYVTITETERRNACELDNTTVTKVQQEERI